MKTLIDELKFSSRVARGKTPDATRVCYFVSERDDGKLGIFGQRPSLSMNTPSATTT